MSALLTIGAEQWCAVFDATETRNAKIVKAEATTASATCPDDAAGDLLRTPDARFADLPDCEFTENYLQAGRIRIHYVDESSAVGTPMRLLHAGGHREWIDGITGLVDVVEAMERRDRKRVYAEIGSTFAISLLSGPEQAAHLLGRLLKTSAWSGYCGARTPCGAARRSS